MSYFGPNSWMPAFRRAPVSAPPQYTQVQKHRRRLQWLPVQYDAEFNLGDEVAEIVGPPAAAIVATVPRPLVLAAEIEAVAGACHDVCSTVVGMLMERREREPELLAAVRHFAALERAQVSDDGIVSGVWAADLVAMVAPFAGPFSVLLKHALPPWHPQLRGEAASDRLVAVLRPLDTAARDLAARIPPVAQRQALGTLAEHRARRGAATKADRVAERLSRLGVTP